MRKQKGFSLIELLIVVAIILIIAAIAIPNLLRARIAANESSAAASVRTIGTAQITYQIAYPAVGYAATVGALGPSAPACTTPSSTNACIIDFVLSSGTKSGYTFASAGAGGPPATQFYSTATPVSTSTGVKGFCGTEDNVVRFAPAGATTIASEAACLLLNPIGQ
jgi:prepilin-type N-terminal cleavage/methylation domain-containing protein